MKLLVPLDNSEFSLKALGKAIEIAKQGSAEIKLISVALDFDDLEGVSSSLAEKLKEKAIVAVNAGKTMVEQAGMTAETRVEIGASPADNIVKYAEEAGIDLIVIGPRGGQGRSRFIMGSVATRVVAYAPCSVYVVR